MKITGNKGMFSRLLRKKEKREDREASERPVPEKEDVKNTTTESDASQAAASGEKPASPLSPPSLVELEIDMTEEEISTIAISLDDLAKELDAGEELETMNSEEFAAAGIAPSGKDLHTLAAMDRITIQIPSEDEEPDTGGGYESAQPQPESDSASHVIDEEEEVELDTGEEEEDVELEVPAEAYERQEVASPEAAALHPPVPEVSQPVTARDAATQYGFPEFVSSDEEAAPTSQPVMETSVPYSLPFEQRTPGGTNDVALGGTGSVEDLLGVGDHVAALAEFLGNCKTPVFVAIQGEAGSGRTSFMRLVEAELEQSSITVRLNPALYRRFGSQKHQMAWLLRDFVTAVSHGAAALEAEQTAKLVDEVMESIDAVFGTALLVEDANLNPEHGDLVVETAGSWPPGSSVHELGYRLKGIIDNSLDCQKKDRVLVFLDDLDRLAPAIAVQCLEEARSVLSVERCALVAACDFDTVKAGLDTSISTGFMVEDKEARSRFQRLFQLAVNVPTPVYDLEGFLANLLRGTAFDLSPDALPDCTALVKQSLGSNPRNIKLLANMLIFAAALRPDVFSPDDTDAETISAKQKLLVSVGCLALAFERVFSLVLDRFPDDETLVSLFCEQLRDSESILELDRDHAILVSAPDKEKAADRLLRFVDSMMHVVAGGKRHVTLDMERLNRLREIIRLISYTAAPGLFPDREDPRRSMLTSLLMRVKDRLARIMKGAAPDKGDSFLRNWPSENPWWRLWYGSNETRNAWGPGCLYYEIAFEIDGSVNLNIALRVEIEKALQTGVEREKLSELKSLPLLRDKIFQYRTLDGNWVEIYRQLGEVRCNTVYDLSFEEIDRVATDLKSLVEATYPLFGTVPVGYRDVRSQPQASQPRPPACRACGAILERTTLQDGSPAYQCITCQKVYKAKATGTVRPQ